LKEIDAALRNISIAIEQGAPADLFAERIKELYSERDRALEESTDGVRLVEMDVDISDI